MEKIIVEIEIEDSTVISCKKLVAYELNKYNDFRRTERSWSVLTDYSDYAIWKLERDVRKLKRKIKALTGKKIIKI